MKNPELYNKTVNILVQSYFDDTLVHGNQCGCAVGNIVAANCGIKIKKEARGICWNSDDTVWKDASWFAYVKNHDPEDPGLEYSREDALKQIVSTGYTADELNRIEKAFEGVDFDFFNDDQDKYMFNGLMAVVDALDEIHENKDEQITTASKKRFNRLVADERSVASKA